jgi:hypothetical protein
VEGPSPELLSAALVPGCLGSIHKLRIEGGDQFSARRTGQLRANSEIEIRVIKNFGTRYKKGSLLYWLSLERSFRRLEGPPDI